ncbi:MOSC domain-containing protein [Cumulibacter soli]|uniref:MOSC domain-containing protein n=1 Tax=Cumulibacter soli TaxID=2546344 RepID=UPI0010687500|nr:MOSC N-terminal beta barrel domain-containing protein [Cumulibacter soli]
MTVTVSALFRYPLKSGRRIEMTEADVLANGIRGDREYMVIDPDGTLVTAREVPPLMLVNSARVVAACEPTGDIRPANVFSWQGLGEDQGDAAAAIVSEVVGREVRVVRFPRKHRRATGFGGGQTMYADGYPLTVASTQSLAEVNRWLDQPVGMERFRPSIVLDGLPGPFVEDDIAMIQIGDVVIDLVKLSGRCVMITIDPESLDKGKQPLHALGQRRALPQIGGGREIMFAVNSIPRTEGTIRVGDEVQVTMHEVPYEQRVAGS